MANTIDVPLPPILVDTKTEQDKNPTTIFNTNELVHGHGIDNDNLFTEKFLRTPSNPFPERNFDMLNVYNWEDDTNFTAEQVEIYDRLAFLYFNSMRHISPEEMYKINEGLDISMSERMRLRREIQPGTLHYVNGHLYYWTLGVAQLDYNVFFGNIDRLDGNTAIYLKNSKSEKLDLIIPGVTKIVIQTYSDLKWTFVNTTYVVTAVDKLNNKLSIELFMEGMTKDDNPMPPDVYKDARVWEAGGFIQIKDADNKNPYDGIVDETDQDQLCQVIRSLLKEMESAAGPDDPQYIKAKLWIDYYLTLKYLELYKMGLEDNFDDCGTGFGIPDGVLDCLKNNPNRKDVIKCLESLVENKKDKAEEEIENIDDTIERLMQTIYYSYSYDIVLCHFFKATEITRTPSVSIKTEVTDTETGATTGQTAAKPTYGAIIHAAMWTPVWDAAIERWGSTTGQQEGATHPLTQQLLNYLSPAEITSISTNAFNANRQRALNTARTNGTWNQYGENTDLISTYDAAGLTQLWGVGGGYLNSGLSGTYHTKTTTSTVTKPAQSYSSTVDPDRLLMEYLPIINIAPRYTTYPNPTNINDNGLSVNGSNSASFISSAHWKATNPSSDAFYVFGTSHGGVKPSKITEISTYTNTFRASIDLSKIINLPTVRLKNQYEINAIPTLFAISERGFLDYMTDSSTKWFVKIDPGDANYKFNLTIENESSMFDHGSTIGVSVIIIAKRIY